MTYVKHKGTNRCHKKQYYKSFLQKRNLDFEFLDIEVNTKNAKALCCLYQNKKLNFPTLVVKNKKLRNPSDKDLLKWIDKSP